MMADNGFSRHWREITNTRKVLSIINIKTAQVSALNVENLN